MRSAPFRRLLRRYSSLILLISAFGSSTTAHALPFYFEFGGTYATLTDPSPLLESQGKAVPTTTSGSYGVPMTLGLQLQEKQKGLLFAVALQNRYVSGNTAAGDSFTFMTTSPVVRLEFWKLVLGAGYTPYVWKNFLFSKNGSIDSVLTVEAQFLFPITIEIDFGLQASRQYFKTDYGDGPNPSSEYGAFFRLNFGFSEAGASERRKYKGWRYPLGSPLN